MDTDHSNYHDCTHINVGNPNSLPEDLSVFAAHRLALLHFYGLCVDHNTEKAIKLFESAANRGNLESAYFLGELYYASTLVPTDERKSEKYYLLAAAGGYLKAQHEYGIIALKNAKTEMQRHEALYWLGMAANQIDGFSAYVLGMIHQTGLHGVDENPCLALDWYDAAKLMGFPDKAGWYAQLKQEYYSTCY